MHRFVPLVALGLLAGCNALPPDNSITVGSFLDPMCARDGSVVRRIYPNAEGLYDTADVSRENCKWNKGT